MKKQRISEVLPYLSSSVAGLIEKLNSNEWLDIEEIRLRSGEPLTVGIWGESCFVTPAGGITNYESDAYTVSSEEVQTAFGRVCENSVYAHLEEIRQGFITIRGGHRVGICGKAVCDGEVEILTAGCCHICKKGSEHSIINTGDEDLCLLTVVVER